MLAAPAPGEPPISTPVGPFAPPPDAVPELSLPNQNPPAFGSSGVPPLPPEAFRMFHVPADPPPGDEPPLPDSRPATMGALPLRLVPPPLGAPLDSLPSQNPPAFGSSGAPPPPADEFTIFHVPTEPPLGAGPPLPDSLPATTPVPPVRLVPPPEVPPPDSLPNQNPPAFGSSGAPPPSPEEFTIFQVPVPPPVPAPVPVPEPEWLPALMAVAGPLNPAPSPPEPDARPKPDE